ncbi:MAG: hypothetical protein ACXAC2_00585 [Candidatus Kariarchaeaceae archaeon]|jgi:hypothetical protein
MNNYLLASKAGALSGRKLAQSLGLNFSVNINNIKGNFNVVFRYGNWQESRKITNDTDVNSVSAIHRISNKSNLWKIMKDEVIVPPYLPIDSTTTVETFKDGEMGLYFGRTKYHRAGKDIIPFYICDEVPDKIEYKVPYIRVSREYRIHYLFGKILKCLRKVNLKDNSDPIIRTSAYGWNFRKAKLENIKHCDSLVNVIDKSAKIIGCSFGGFDVGWSPPWNQWILFEVNSAPALNSETLKIYSQQFKEVMSDVYKPIKNPSRSESIN